MDYKLVEVKWVDHCSYPGWHHCNDFPDTPAVNYTIGYLVKETDSELVLAQTVIPALDTIGELIVLVKANVTCMVELSE